MMMRRETNIIYTLTKGLSYSVEGRRPKNDEKKRRKSLPLFLSKPEMRGVMKKKIEEKLQLTVGESHESK